MKRDEIEVNGEKKRHEEEEEKVVGEKLSWGYQFVLLTNIYAHIRAFNQDSRTFVYVWWWDLTVLEMPLFVEWMLRGE